MVDKKSKVEETDGLEDFELDDLDSDIDLDQYLNSPDLEDNRKPSKLSIAKDVAKSGIKSFFSSLAEKSAKKALPTEYRYFYSESLDIYNTIKDSVSSKGDEIGKSVYTIAKGVKKILPFQLKTLDKYLEEKKLFYEKEREKSEEEKRNEEIESVVSSIFDKQLEVQKALEARKEAEEVIDKKVSFNLSKASLDHLTSIDNNISQSTAFTLQVSKAYFKKSLELQFKSYYIQLDMLRTMREYYKGFSIQLDSINKNTALPDYVKLTNKEKFSDVAKNKFFSSMYSSLFDKNSYLATVKNNIKDFIENKLSNFNFSLFMLDSMLDQAQFAKEMMKEDKSSIPTTISSAIGSFLGEKQSDKLAQYLEKKLKNSKKFSVLSNYMKLFSASPESLFESLKSKVEDKEFEAMTEEGVKGFIKEKGYGALSEVLSLFTPKRESLEVGKESILEFNKPAIFDNKAYRSLTEVIPLYLAKILKETSDIRGMYYTVNRVRLKGFTESKELMYDYTRRILDTKENVVSEVTDNLFKDISYKRKIEGLVDSINRKAQRELSKDKTRNIGKLSRLKDKKAKEAFTRYLERASQLDDIDFTKENIIDNYEKDERLRELVEQNKELKAYLDIIKEANAVSPEEFKEVKRNYPIEPIKELVKNLSIMTNIDNDIDEEKANILSKAFIEVILNENTSLTPELVKSGVVFKYLTKKDYNKVKDVIKTLIAQVNYIDRENDIVKKSNMQALFGVVNKALKGNININPEVFKALSQYSYELVKPGKLGVENIVEAKIGANKAKEYIDEEVLEELTQPSSDYSDFDEDTIVASTTFTSITNRLSAIGSNLKDTLIRKYDAFNKALDSLLNDIKEIKEENKAKILATIKENIKLLINKVDDISATQKAKYLEDIKVLSSEALSVANTQYKEKMKVLDELKSSLTSLYNSIDASSELNLKDTLELIYIKLKEIKNRLKAYLKLG